MNTLALKSSGDVLAVSVDTTALGEAVVVTRSSKTTLRFAGIKIEGAGGGRGLLSLIKGVYEDTAGVRTVMASYAFGSTTVPKTAIGAGVFRSTSEGDEFLSLTGEQILRGGPPTTIGSLGEIVYSPRRPGDEVTLVGRFIRYFSGLPRARSEELAVLALPRNPWVRLAKGAEDLYPHLWAAVRAAAENLRLVIPQAVKGAPLDWGLQKLTGHAPVFLPLLAGAAIFALAAREA